MVTLAEVATHAGVSLATASRALHGTRRMSEELRERVRGSAAELGYEVNNAARTLAGGASNLIGLIVHDLMDPYYAAIADGAMVAADRHGLVVTVGATRRSADRELALVTALRAQRARVIVLAGSRSTEDSGQLNAEIELYRAGGGHVAAIGNDVLGVPTVAPANKEGAAALANALTELGHTKFAVLAGPEGLLVARDRAEGFAEALAARKLPAPLVVHGGFDRDGGYAAAAEIGDATCVFAVNDVMAVGAMAALRERGVSVPGDVSVAGFDDIPTLRDLVPALTTVRLPLTELGERAVELALSDQDETVAVAAEVILRESTRRI
ncbi:LacI family DNA-binding transcriptional regulator [Actinokineospora sp. HUAS TT18]|uniref:LacI family DNA-binding transcriptional regulator n=1 Tax=Actinokineospora sp. HUAS TT18 TaxID=3447451 RepID=UPI003F51D1BF